MVRVQDRLSVARTFHKLKTGAGFLFPDIFSTARYQAETLETTEATYQQELDESESFVKRGDPVVQTIGDEYLSG